MVFPEHIRLFTIREMCHACGVSRTTLIRMEESGFLKPCRVDPDTGYRYYDLQNVAAVGQYQFLNATGFSRREIADLYYERIDSRAFLRAQRQRLSRMQRFLDQYELRHDHSKNGLVSFVSLPAVTCFCEEVIASSDDEAGKLTYLLHEKCVAEGFQMHGSDPIFSIPPDGIADMDCLNLHHHGICCIPVVPDGRQDPRLRFFPATDAISIIGFGDYAIVPSLWEKLWKEYHARELEASGPARLIALVAPYSGTHHKTDDFCYECAIPVKERKK